MPRLFIIPTPIVEQDTTHLPAHTTQVIQSLDHFIVERVRTIRRLIRALLPDYDINSATFLALNKRAPLDDIPKLRDILGKNQDIGLLSEAGYPCIADPGHYVVECARSLHYDIVPLSGPSSILLALMASGMNGQEFTFHGYLPIKGHALKDKIKKLEKEVQRTGYTQLFIETPYRNINMFKTLMQELAPQTRLCIAADLTHPTDEYIHTQTIAQWKKDSIPPIDKKPCIFLIGK